MEWSEVEGSGVATHRKVEELRDVRNRRRCVEAECCSCVDLADECVWISW